VHDSNVPFVTETVKYPGSAEPRLGAENPAGIVILSVPYEGDDAHFTVPAP
jgi:hypothetical protein